MQLKNEKVDVYRAVANFELRADLKMGDRVHQPYRSVVRTQNYSRGTDVTIRDLTDTDESLTVSTSRVVAFYVDDFDALQSNYPLRKSYAEDSAVQIGNDIDGDVFSDYDQATSTISNLDINGGSASEGFTLDSSNILKVFSTAKKKLKRLNVTENLFALISPDVEAVLLQYLAGKESALGDSSGLNGNIGSFYGFDLYVSNNLSGTAVLNIAVTPSNADTITISGVTFTFVSSIGTTAGNVLISGTSTSASNLAGLINAPSTTDANGVALSAANADNFSTKYTATASGANVTVEGRGASYLTVTSSNGSNAWSGATQLQRVIFGKKDAFDVIIQSEVDIRVKDDPDRLGSNVIVGALWGKKVFNNRKDWLVDCRVRSDAF